MIRNKFKAWCRTCRRYAPPGEAWLLDKDETTGRWRAACDACMRGPAADVGGDRGRTYRADPPPYGQPRYEDAPPLPPWLFIEAMSNPRLRRAIFSPNAAWLYANDEYARAYIESLRQRPTAASVPSCLATLGLRPPVTRDDVRRAYRERAKAIHPDHGGDAGAFVRLRRAHDEAMMMAGGAA